MNYRGILEEIEASSPGENAADILTMVHLIEPFVGTRRTIAQFYDDFELRELDEVRSVRAARIAGTLLCILFAPVKPPEYRSKMKQVRQKYEGISRSPSAQAAFRRGLEMAKNATAFYNFKRAQEFLPDALARAY